MKLLVLGAGGQVGHELSRPAWPAGYRGSAFCRAEIDTTPQEAVPAAVARLPRVVADQIGSPTSAVDIAAAIAVIVQRLTAGDRAWGTYHFAGAGAVSWHGFAEAIFELAAPWRGAPPKVEAITTAEYPTPARRPANSVLDCSRIREAFGVVPRPWREALAEVIGELYESASPPG